MEEKTRLSRLVSRRLPRDLTPTPWARARAARGKVPYDLTVSNPTLCGFNYPHTLLDPLRGRAALQYRPDPKGLRVARETVAAEYGRRGVSVDPERIVLTASSSESYGLLFKLLCDPGQGVLVPTPSYPLFEHLASLEGVRAIPYMLDPTGEWQPIAPALTPAANARAAILVHPNNPTGSWVYRSAAEQVARSSGTGLLPLIVDEVFLDFSFAPHAAGTTYAARTQGLTFTLGGLSKSRGLPQMKLSWIVVSGPAEPVASAMEGLSFIADSYLSVASPIQEALAEILERAAPIRDAIRVRCMANLARAREIVKGVPGIELLTPAAGWNAVLRFPRVVTEDDLVMELLDRFGVAVLPGYFFDFSTDGHLVVSLLPVTDVFDGGFWRVVAAIREHSPAL